MIRGCATFLVSVAVLASGAGLAGCAMYMNYPPLEGDTSINNPNISPMPEVVEIGLLEVTRRYPVSGEYVVNLPRGMSVKNAQWVRDGLGDPARLVGPGTESLPVFHVTRVWIRGGDARVEVLAPEVRGAGPRGVVVELNTTGIGEWRIERVRELAAGAVEAPELFGWDTAGEAP